MPRTRTTLTAVGAVGAALALSVTATAVTSSPARVDPGFTQDRSAALAKQIDPAKPRNVILIIGDGTDDAMITAARNYELGASGRWPGLDSLPFTGAMTTYGLKVGTGPDYPIAYVSDSAPTASGWSTGKKTVDSRLSQGPSTALNVPGEDYETVLERYEAQGKLTGNVTTSELTDATPAAAAAHINNRACQGPADMSTCTAAQKANGGKGSVAEQLVDNGVDVLLGGGLNRYNQATDAGPSVLDYAKSQQGYRTVATASELDAVTSLKDGPVLGLFANGNMTPMYAPLVATVPPGAGGASQTCSPADRGTQPDLSAMAEKSIQLLDNPKGFFLQVESAMVDKQEHAMDICGAIGDVKELDQVVQVALDYQKKNPDTLIVVTGDHSHSTQIVGDGTGGRQTTTLKTADGDPMTVAYSTGIGGSNHTGSQIRVAASGPQAANVTGVIDQTDLFRTMLGRTPSKVPGQQAGVAVAAAPTVTVAQLRRQGVQVSVAGTATSKIVVRLTKGARTLDSATLRGKGGKVRLSTKAPVSGSLTVRAVATGAGGKATGSTSVRVTR
ncbi:alkaline phosphatase [Nocardioides hungaricus]